MVSLDSSSVLLFFSFNYNSYSFFKISRLVTAIYLLISYFRATNSVISRICSCIYTLLILVNFI